MAPTTHSSLAVNYESTESAGRITGVSCGTESACELLLCSRELLAPRGGRGNPVAGARLETWGAVRRNCWLSPWECRRTGWDQQLPRTQQGGLCGNPAGSPEAGLGRTNKLPRTQQDGWCGNPPGSPEAGLGRTNNFREHSRMAGAATRLARRKLAWGGPTTSANTAGWPVRHPAWLAGSWTGRANNSREHSRMLLWGRWRPGAPPVA
jgi:hypothetical protein